MSTQWRLKEFLSEHNIKPAALAQATEGRLSRTSVYALSRGAEAVRLDTLDTLLPALSILTGRRVDVGDLIVYDGDPAEPPTQKKAWRRLIGALQDPDGPTDMAERHDDYLAEAEWEDHQAGSLRGQR